jgi:hypothetical protein
VQIEVGKYYRTRDGRMVGPMEWDTHEKWPWDVNGTAQLWDNEGKCDEGSNFDLIAEWTDEPAVASFRESQGGEIVSTATGETVATIHAGAMMSSEYRRAVKAVFYALEREFNPPPAT